MLSPNEFRRIALKLEGAIESSQSSFPNVKPSTQAVRSQVKHFSSIRWLSDLSMSTLSDPHWQKRTIATRCVPVNREAVAAAGSTVAFSVAEAVEIADHAAVDLAVSCMRGGPSWSGTTDSRTLDLP